MSDLVKIARARVTDIQQTHWEGCERDHRECLIQRMADEIERLTAENEKLRLALEVQPGPVNMEDVEWAGKAHLTAALRERDELRRQLAEADRRFDWFAERLEDVQIDNADPNDHYLDGEEDVPYTVLWRRAIDAAMGLTRPAEDA